MANQSVRVKLAIFLTVVIGLSILCVFLLLIKFRPRPNETDSSFILVTPLVNIDETATPYVPRANYQFDSNNKVESGFN